MWCSVNLRSQLTVWTLTVCVSIRSPVSRWTSRALRTYAFWFYMGQQMVSLWKKTHKPSDGKAASSWLLISLLLLANVHFQHTAELVKLLSVINVNYRLQVRPSDRHTPLTSRLTSDLTPDLWPLCRSSRMRVMMSSAGATCCAHSSPSTETVLLTIYLFQWKPVITTTRRSTCDPSAVIYADLTWTKRLQILVRVLIYTFHHWFTLALVCI